MILPRIVVRGILAELRLTLDLHDPLRHSQSPVVEFSPRLYVEGDDEGMPMTAVTETTITRNDAESRYEIHVDDVLAGFTVFRIDTRGRLIFPHTEVDPAFRGRGIAQELVAGAMTDVAQRGETVIPHCPVVTAYLRKNEVPGLDIIWPTHPHPE